MVSAAEIIEYADKSRERYPGNIEIAFFFFFYIECIRSYESHLDSSCKHRENYYQMIVLRVCILI